MGGAADLRKAVAKLYNHTYREGMESQYTYENVCIVPGGRAGLSRVASVVSDVYCVRIRVCRRDRTEADRLLPVIPSPGLHCL